MAGEAYTEPDTKQKRVRFYVDWGAFQQCREGNHPAFDYPDWLPWEIAGLMKLVAAQLCVDVGAQHMATEQRSRRQR